VQPTITRAWTIQGWGIQVQAFIDSPGGSVKYGRLGQLIAAVIPAQSTPTPATRSFAGVPSQALANAETLWDGSLDPPFPANQKTQPQNEGWIAASFNLPQPIVLHAGEGIGVGLWLTPSLVSNANIVLAAATYQLLYDTQSPA
jgi:hypothetical protein